MKIAEWMTHPVRSVRPRDSIRHARALLEEYRINQLPVTVDGRVVGIVTDRDLRDAFPSVFDPKHGHAFERTLDSITVDAVMTFHVLTLGPDETIDTAAHLMRRERIGALPIVGTDGRLVGILTRSDLLDAFTAGAPAGVHPTVAAARRHTAPHPGTHP